MTSEGIEERIITEKALKCDEEISRKISENPEEVFLALQEEKMASIGRLAAGLAHEINNPMAYVVSNLTILGKYIDRLNKFIKIQSECIHSFCDTEIVEELNKSSKRLKLDYIIDDSNQLIEDSLEGANKVKNIIQNLKMFSGIDNVEYEEADINSGLESTIKIVCDEFKHKTKVIREYGNIPMIRCNLAQINQAFLNILLNAVHSIRERGEITVRTRCNDGFTYVSISDTGRGIPRDNLGRVFDPFFTTKEAGTGTGLGLYITYDIVKKHDWDINIESKVGEGTTLTIKIPVK